LEGLTKEEIRISKEALFKSVSFLTNLPFHDFPNISSTTRGSQFWENREKAGLSKTAMSCRRLVSTRFGLRTSEKCFLRNPDFFFCQSFQNIRLGSIKLQDDDSISMCLSNSR
jgi:hypothetical protein